MLRNIKSTRFLLCLIFAAVDAVAGPAVRSFTLSFCWCPCVSPCGRHSGPVACCSGAPSCERPFAPCVVVVVSFGLLHSPACGYFSLCASSICCPLCPGESSCSARCPQFAVNPLSRLLVHLACLLFLLTVLCVSSDSCACCESQPRGIECL